MLAPYSSLTVSVDIALDVSIASAVGVGQYGSAAATLVGTYRDGEPDGGTLIDGSMQVAHDDELAFDPEAHEARTLTITIDNATALPSKGYFYFELGATANLGPLSAVPEPAQWALSGAGMAVLGLF